MVRFPPTHPPTPSPGGVGTGVAPVLLAFDTRNGTWAEVPGGGGGWGGGPPPTQARYGAGMAAGGDGRLYLFGGREEGTDALVEGARPSRDSDNDSAANPLPMPTPPTPTKTERMTAMTMIITTGR